jgi:hypothetical protein
MSSITIATPYEYRGLLYFSSGYVGDSSRPIYAVRPGAKGDISLKAGESSNEFVGWSLPKAAPYNPTTLIYDDRLYVLLDRGFVSCFRPRDGKEIYSQKRLPNGRAFTSSPWACDGKVFCLDEDGVTFVLQAGDEFKVLHTNTLAEDDMCMATPALAGDRLLIRTAARIYCIAASAANLKETRPAAARVDPPQLEPADWPMHNHDLAGRRFNPTEKTLSAANVGKLVGDLRGPRNQDIARTIERISQILISIGSGVEEPIFPLLKSPEPAIRGAACGILAEVGTPTSVQPLEEAGRALLTVDSAYYRFTQMAIAKIKAAICVSPPGTWFSNSESGSNTSP